VLIWLLASLPIASWIPGGHDAPWYSDRLEEWLAGTLVAAGLVVVLLVIDRRVPIWREGRWTRLAARAAERPLATGVALSLSALSLYIAVALWVFSAAPLHLDEVAQVYQARVFASGALTGLAPEFPEFSSLMHLVDAGGRRFSQYPPGGPALLAPGALVNATWLMSPLLGAGAVALWWGITRRLERPSVALAASVVFAGSPFVMFMSGSHMNHAAALFWMLAASYGLLRSTEQGSTTWFAALAGFAFGALAMVRPVDALAFALPGGVWLTLRAFRARGIPSLVASALALLVPVGGLLWFNAQTTGNPLLFAYEQQWGSEHGLGFHAAPWGSAHTPARGLELINLYFLRLQSYLFEAPVPSLVFAVAAFGLTRRMLGAFDRYVLAGGVALVLLYFAYWHDGFYLGPRFVYLLTPVLALWTARFAAAVREQWPSAIRASRAAVYLSLASVAVTALLSVPARARSYQAGLRSMRLDAVGLAAERGIRGSLILVRESWGSQLIARLWALGVSRPATESLYRTIDACLLDEALGDLEQRSITGEDAVRALAPLVADSSRLVPSTLSPDRSQRMMPGARYTPTCAARIAEDRAGFTLFAPLLVRSWGDNIYARDLHARDSVLFVRYPDRPLFLLRSESSDGDAPLVLEAITRDSVFAAWNASRSMPASTSKP
jgi:4-amino-4-deoxy-L-arabinose transferase-like glycosyltransferase